MLHGRARAGPRLHLQAPAEPAPPTTGRLLIVYSTPVPPISASRTWQHDSCSMLHVPCARTPTSCKRLAHRRVLLVCDEHAHHCGLEGGLGHSQLPEELSQQRHVTQAVCDTTAKQLVTLTCECEGVEGPAVGVGRHNVLRQRTNRNLHTRYELRLVIKSPSHVSVKRLKNKLSGLAVTTSCGMAVQCSWLPGIGPIWIAIHIYRYGRGPTCAQPAGPHLSFTLLNHGTRPPRLLTAPTTPVSHVKLDIPDAALVSMLPTEPTM